MCQQGSVAVSGALLLAALPHLSHRQSSTRWTLASLTQRNGAGVVPLGCWAESLRDGSESVAGSGGVGAWWHGYGPAAGQSPDEGAWLGMLEVPAGGLLGGVVPPAKRGQVAFAGAA